MPSMEELFARRAGPTDLRTRADRIGRAITEALSAAGLLGRRPAPFVAPAGSGLVPGSFTAHTHRGDAGSMAYKLYVPRSATRAPMPLLLMLHGCKQNPDDFAAGTRMNALADERGFVVAYPAQDVRDNGHNCWNWFVPAQQQRGGREPSLIAGIVGDVGALLPVDARRVFVAGLSAGGAMAAVLGGRYPELFAGIGVHSGLALGAAHSVPSAFAAMRGQGRTQAPSTTAAVRTIVLHGDEDPTVAAVNADAVVLQALEAFARHGTALRSGTPVAVAAHGRPALRTDHVDEAGNVLVREWRVQGGRHTWFGGSAAGSYTDPAGPDASAELVKFFLG